MLDAKRVGLSLGIIWGATMFLTTLLSIWTGYGKAMLEMMTGLYPGYDITIVGSFVGAAYGFLDLFVMGYIFAWFYNKLEKKKL